MNKRLFNINDQIHALLTSTSNPNILIPIRGVVKDIKHDLKNPLYRIKITKFYDSWTFLKKYFLDNNYTYSFTDRPRPSRIKIRDVSSYDSLMEKIENPDEEDRYYIVIDSLMSFKFFNEMQDAFEKIQSFIIHKRHRELMELQTRPFYDGKYRIHTQQQWFIAARELIAKGADDSKFKKIVDNF